MHLQNVQQLKEEQKMDITYHEENGYLIPNVQVGCVTSQPNRRMHLFGIITTKAVLIHRRQGNTAEK